jgi:NAD(P)H-hydrate repair Nnr-like enzyme with NAD(P)H-hydrate dehydratase domain
VTVGAPGAALIENAARLDAVMLRRCDGADDLGALLADPRITTVALGPGLGVGARTRACALAAVTARGASGVVLDADALSSFEDAPEERRALFDACCGGSVVLTPHWGEFRRLFPGIAERYGAAPERGALVSRVDAAEAAARESGATVLLKGADTVIAPPDGPASLHAAVYEQAAPWLATAGAGDVLTGLIAGLLARGLPAQRAAAQAAWLHVAAARSFGPGLIAEDIPEALPQVLKTLAIPSAATLGAGRCVG